MDPSFYGPRRIVPIGTKIVVSTPRGASDDAPSAGAVGVVVAAPLDPFHAYRVRLVDGRECSLRRTEFAVLRELQADGLHPPGDAPPNVSMDTQVIFRCVIGSRAYGLNHAASDVDVRGIYLPTAEAQWSLFGVPEQIECDETQTCYWELRKFLVLALKANPNVLECLYTPQVEHADPLARELLEHRHLFLSKLIYQTYNGYVVSQFKKLGQDLRNQGRIRWKHAMHLIRLLLSGVTALRDGVIPVRVEDHRDALLAIRDGQTAWDEVEAWRLRLHAEFDAAYAVTTLPDRPDYAWADAFLVRARRWRAEHG